MDERKSSCAVTPGGRVRRYAVTRRHPKQRGAVSKFPNLEQWLIDFVQPRSDRFPGPCCLIIPAWPPNASSWMQGSRRRFWRNSPRRSSGS
ncbi:hypothetical protein BGLA2_750016 [Burkholderia gladioli]|nr:hypothetical protein BGLA2_750016 [Burkholderia gladioli]